MQSLWQHSRGSIHFLFLCTTYPGLLLTPSLLMCLESTFFQLHCPHHYISFSKQFPESLKKKGDCLFLPGFSCKVVGRITILAASARQAPVEEVVVLVCAGGLCALATWWMGQGAHMCWHRGRGIWSGQVVNQPGPALNRKGASPV